ncbi:uncharacterized protein DDB_G0287625-like [Helianthus annuus]|uniref:uncharacterized protein DDB_G0287625-like n=1 Tax=Helianthus annuus TaxID=4232 RepID=UPI001652CDB6|nr:uncharacterized protein DDB_G0287625-like [Helianthus annuus]
MVGSDITGYTQRFHDLSRVIPYLVTPEYKRIERYIWGLAPEIRSHVTAAEPTTITQAVTLAVSLNEDAIRMKKYNVKGDEKKDSHVESSTGGKRSYSNFKKGTRRNNNYNNNTNPNNNTNNNTNNNNYNRNNHNNNNNNRNHNNPNHYNIKQENTQARDAKAFIATNDTGPKKYSGNVTSVESLATVPSHAGDQEIDQERRIEITIGMEMGVSKDVLDAEAKITSKGIALKKTKPVVDHL